MPFSWGGGRRDLNSISFWASKTAMCKSRHTGKMPGVLKGKGDNYAVAIQRIPKYLTAENLSKKNRKTMKDSPYIIHKSYSPNKTLFP